MSYPQPTIHFQCATVRGDVYEIRPLGGDSCGGLHRREARSAVETAHGTWCICRACDMAWFVPR